MTSLIFLAFGGEAKRQGAQASKVETSSEVAQHLIRLLPAGGLAPLLLAPLYFAGVLCDRDCLVE